MGIREFFNKGSFDFEISRLEKRVSENTRDAGARLALGDLYYRQGDQRRAAAIYQEVVDIHLSSSEPEKALTVARKAISTDLFAPLTANEVFAALLTKGFKTEVIDLCLQLAKKKMVSNRPFANDLFRKILHLDPDNKDALAFFQRGKPGVDEQEEPALTSESEEEASGMPLTSDSDSPAPERTAVDREPAAGLPEKRGPQKSRPSSQPDLLKEKFLSVAKEKNQLESTIIKQEDAIRQIEKERERLTRDMAQLVEDNRKLKEKLLDFDVLRNMEISEMKGQMENLLSEIKRLRSDQELSVQALTRDHEKQSEQHGDRISALTKEKELLEAVLEERAGELSAKRGVVERLESERIELEQRQANLLREKEELLAEQNRELALKQDIVTQLEAERTAIEAGRSELVREKEELDAKSRSMMEDLDVLRQALKEKELELEKAKSGLLDAGSRAKEVEDELSSARDVIDEKERAVDDLLAERHRLSAEIEDLHSEIASLRERAEDLQSAASLRESDLSALLGQLKEAEEMRDEATEEIRTLTSAIETLKTEKSLSEDNLLHQIMVYHDQIAKLREDLADRQALFEEKERLSSEIEGLYEQAAYYRQQADDLRASSGEKEHSLSAAQRSLTEALAGTREQQEQIEAKDRLIQEMEAEREGLLALRQTLLTEKEDLSARNTALNEKAEALRTSLGDNEQRLSAAHEGIEDALARLKDRQEQIEAKDRLIHEMEGEREGLLALRQTLLTEKEDLSARGAALGEEVATLRRAIGDKELELTEARERLAHSSGAEEVAQAELFSLRERLSALSAELEEHGERAEDLESSLAGKAAAHEEALSALATARAEFDDLAGKRELLMAEKVGLETAIENLEQDLAEVRAALTEKEAALAGATGRVDFTQARNLELEAAVNTKDSLIAAMKVEVSKLSHEVASLISERSELRETATGLERMLGDLREHLGEKERLLSETGELLRTALDKGTALEAEIANWEALLANKDSALAAGDAERQRLADEIQSLKEDLASLERSREALEAAATQSELELRENIEALVAEKARSEGETAEILRLRNGEISALQSERDSLGTMLREKDSLISNLEQRLTEAGGLLAERERQLSETTHHALERTKEISERLEQAMDENLPLREAAAEAGKGIAVLSGRIDEATGQIAYLTAEYVRERDAFLSVTRAYEDARDRFESENESLRSVISELKDQILTTAQRVQEHLSTDQRLGEDLSGTLMRILDIGSDTNRRLAELASAGTGIAEVKSAMTGYHSRIEGIIVENEGLRQRVSESENTIRGLSAEKTAMEDKIGDFERELARLRERGEILPPASGPANLDVSSPFGEEKAAGGSLGRYIAIAAVLVLVVVGALVYQGRSPGPSRTEMPVVIEQNKPAVAPPAGSLSYREIFNAATRSVNARSFKVKATVLTKELLAKEGSGHDLSRFDFEKYIYVKVSINSLKGGLSPDLMQDPLTRVALSNGRTVVSPSADVVVEEQKTFYRREEPVSLTFFSAFPREKLGQVSALSLAMQGGNGDLRLEWDAQSVAAMRI